MRKASALKFLRSGQLISVSTYSCRQQHLHSLFRYRTWKSVANMQICTLSAAVHKHNTADRKCYKRSLSSLLEGVWSPKTHLWIKPTVVTYPWYMKVWPAGEANQRYHFNLKKKEKMSPRDSSLTLTEMRYKRWLSLDNSNMFFSPVQAWGDACIGGKKRDGAPHSWLLF